MNFSGKHIFLITFISFFILQLSYCQVLSRLDIQKRLENVPVFIELYDYDNAMKCVDEVIYNDPTNHSAYRYKIRILCIQKNFDLAVDMVQRLMLIDKSPDKVGLGELTRNILTNGIENEDSWTQIEAAEKLAELGDTTGQCVLQKVFAKKIARIRVASALARLGDTTAIYYLEDILQKGNFPEKLNAANALAAIGDKSVIPELKQIMKTGELRLKIGIAAALYQLGDETGLNLLTSHLKETDPVIQMTSATILAKRKDPQAISVLKTLLDNPNTKVRTGSINTLGRYGDTALLSTFSQMTETGSLELTLLDARIRLGDKTDMNILINKLKSENGVQLRAAKTIYDLIKEGKM